MKRINSFWEFVMPLGHRLLYHHLFCLVIACILDSLLLLHMLLQLIAVLLFSFIQGWKNLFYLHLLVLSIYPIIYSTNIFFMFRAIQSEFVIQLSKYIKAVFHTRISVGMRFRMLFETEESSVRRWWCHVSGNANFETEKIRSSWYTYYFDMFSDRGMGNFPGTWVL